MKEPVSTERTSRTRVAVIWKVFGAVALLTGFLWMLYGMYQEIKGPELIDAPQFRQTIDRLMEEERENLDS